MHEDNSELLVEVLKIEHQLARHHHIGSAIHSSFPNSEAAVSAVHQSCQSYMRHINPNSTPQSIVGPFEYSAAAIRLKHPAFQGADIDQGLCPVVLSVQQRRLSCCAAELRLPTYERCFEGTQLIYSG